MISKREIESHMKGIVNDRFIQLWWDLRLPAFGMDKPSEVFEQDPARLLDYVKNYKPA